MRSVGCVVLVRPENLLLIFMLLLMRKILQTNDFTSGNIYKWPMFIFVFWESTVPCKVLVFVG